MYDEIDHMLLIV